MKPLFAGLFCLALTTTMTTASAFADDGPLPAGKPAGIHRAALNASATEIAVGVAVAAAIAIILAASTSSSAPVTAG